MIYEIAAGMVKVRLFTTFIFNEYATLKVETNSLTNTSFQGLFLPRRCLKDGVKSRHVQTLLRVAAKTG